MDKKIRTLYSVDSEDLVGSPVKRFFRLIDKEKKDVLLIYFFSIFSGVIALTLPLGVQAIINITLGSSKLTASWYILIFIVIIGVTLSGFIQVIQLSISEKIQQRIFARASFEFVFRIPRMKLEALTKYYSPELVNRFFDVLTVQKGLSKILMDFSSNILSIFFGLILLSFYDSSFVFFGVFILLTLGIILNYTGQKGLKTSIAESKYKYETAHWLQEVARAMSVYKLAGYTSIPMDRTDHLVTKYVDTRRKHFSVLIGQYFSIITFKTVISSGLLILGSILLINQKINIGQFVASEIVILSIVSSVEKLVLSLETIYDVLTGIEKMGNVTDLPIETEQGVNFEQIDTGKGIKIEVKNLSYRFAGAERDSLTDISFTLQPGEKVCVAGYNSSGKSTLLNIISTLFHDYTGSIMYNDYSLRNINLMSLRNFAGESLSNKELVNGSIEDNISMGRDDITFTDVKRAASYVGLDDYVQKLPIGYNTVIVPGDMTVPRSVVNKIALARSIAENPRIFLLDEVFLNMQRDEKDKVIDFFTDPNKPWTMLAASSDARFASKCDKVIILNNGRIQDIGTFVDIAQKPYFDNIFLM